MKYIWPFFFFWLGEFVLIASVAAGLAAWHDDPGRRLINISICASGLVIFSGVSVFFAWYYTWLHESDKDQPPKHTRRTPPPI